MSSGAALNIFSLREHVLADYERFTKTFTKIHAEDVKQQIDAIYADNHFWPEPLLQINPNYKSEKSILQWTENGDLHPLCADIFQVNGQPIQLYKHQDAAIAQALQNEKENGGYVVTTGTGSGKSLCFFIPIVDRILKNKETDSTPRTRAIIIYPMNALANSQQKEIEKFISNIKGAPPVTIRSYTGQEKWEKRQEIAENPPDILLTNYMMLEMLMTRQEELDKKVISNCEGLQFLVLDELHTYRGRQGSDVAMLLRRVRSRLKPANLRCIGTSATMASEGTAEDRNRIIAEVASKLFSVKIGASQIINETLERITDPDKTVDDILDQLGEAIDTKIPENISDQELKKHPLAIWVELTLGIEYPDGPANLRRAKPKTVSEAVKRLADASGRSEDACRDALLHLLSVSSVTERERVGDPSANPRAVFAFKLHQFISGAAHAHSTLEPPPHRYVTVDEQQFSPEAPEKRLYPVHFCRECGQEYHPVRVVNEGGRRQLYARDIDDTPPAKDADRRGGTAGTSTHRLGEKHRRLPRTKSTRRSGYLPH